MNATNDNQPKDFHTTVMMYRSNGFRLDILLYAIDDNDLDMAARQIEPVLSDLKYMGER